MITLQGGLAEVQAILDDESAPCQHPLSTMGSIQGAFTDPVKSFLQDPFTAGAAPSMDDIAKAIGIVNAAKTKLTQCDPSAPFAGAVDFADAAPATVEPAVAAAFLPSQAALIIGLADFMVARAKDEAVFSFLLHLRDNVDGKPIIEHGMPRSWELMQLLETGAYQTLLPAVRTAFTEDLHQLPRRLNSAELRREIGWSTTPTYVQGLSVAFSRGLEIRNGVPPIVAVQNLLEVSSDELQNDTLRAFVHLVGLSAREYAVGGADTLIQELARPGNAELRKYFVGFVTHDAVQMGDFAAGARSPFLAQAKQAEQQMIHLLQQVHQLRQTVRAMDEATGASPSELSKRALVGIGSLLQVVNTGRRFLPQMADAEVREFDRVIDDALTLHQAVVSREYSRIITWLVSRPEIRAKLDEDALHYLTLGSSLAAANSAEEVTEVLQAAAVPPGSYLAKRYQRPSATTLGAGGAPAGEGAQPASGSFWSKLRPQSVSVTGYLGGQFGREGTADTPVLQGDSWFAGVALPVGVEVSTGFPGGALSIFAPILDLGTIASARWGGPDEVDTSAEIGFEQVFAPGLYLVYNVGGIPLSMGVGIQAVPNLRSEETAEGEEREVDAVRFGGFVGVDAPLFHFRFRRGRPRTGRERKTVEQGAVVPPPPPPGADANP